MVRQQHTPERKIDSRTLARVWHFYNSNPSVRACVKVLRACIFAGGIKPRSGGSSRVVDRHCRQLLERALDWMLVVGIVPVTRGTIVAPDGGRVRVPIVPGNDFVELGVLTNPESGHVSYNGKTKSNGVMGQSSQKGGKKGNVMVWDAGKDTPTGEGALCTDMVTLWEREELLRCYRKYALIAHAERCNPRVFTQAQGKGNGDSNGVNWMQPEDTFVASEKQRLKAADDVLADQVSGRGVGARSGTSWPRTLVGVPELADTLPDEYPLAAERNLVRHISAEAPTGIAEMEEAARSECLRVFCIPEAVFTAQNRASDTHLQDYVFNCVLRKWQTALQAFMDGALATCDAAIPRYDIESVPCVTPATLSMLYTDGAVTLETYTRIAGHSLGIESVPGKISKRPTAGMRTNKEESAVKKRKTNNEDENLSTSP